AAWKSARAGWQRDFGMERHDDSSTDNVRLADLDLEGRCPGRRRQQATASARGRVRVSSEPEKIRNLTRGMIINMPLKLGARGDENKRVSQKPGIEADCRLSGTADPAAG
ncbi:hypothetical protein, partial [Phaeovulum sp. NW3]|uniref:hypothetical protein n=1 Tax=Phaeovulum sp. NW3 TaxID=2934933 RepID=UPI002020724A